MNRTAILLDIDGVLGPIGSSVGPDAIWVSGGWNSTLIGEHVPGLLRCLSQLGELVWYTSWQEEAHALEAPLGLPELDVVPMGNGDGAPYAKLDGLEGWERRQSFDRIVVLDDEIPADAIIPNGVAVIPVDPAEGLRFGHLDRVAQALRRSAA